MRKLVRVALVCLAGLVIAVAVYVFLPAVGSVSGSALNSSLAGEAGGGFGLKPCGKRRDGRWDCNVGDSHGSGSAGYRVDMHGRCWKAVKTEAGEEGGSELPGRVAGCVKFYDQARLFDRIVGN